MKVNHLIIGASNVLESVEFYSNLFKFEPVDSFIDTGTGKQGEVLNLISDGHFLQLLIVPFGNERLPNPQHIAFEVNKESFKSIYERAITLKIPLRKNPPLDDNAQGIGELNSTFCTYNIFYVTDPSKINVEIMCSQQK
jgi:catechol 2,3-dioxygenase-like lactoylglutathione lyase family enzyme